VNEAKADIFFIVIVLFSWADALMQFAFAPVVSSSGMPRAKKRAGGFLAPSTPGRLGYENLGLNSSSGYRK
jgi:hypothetical protein